MPLSTSYPSIRPYGVPVPLKSGLGEGLVFAWVPGLDFDLVQGAAPVAINSRAAGGHGQGGEAHSLTLSGSAGYAYDHPAYFPTEALTLLAFYSASSTNSGYRIFGTQHPTVSPFKGYGLDFSSTTTTTVRFAVSNTVNTLITTSTPAWPTPSVVVGTYDRQALQLYVNGITNATPVSKTEAIGYATTSLGVHLLTNSKTTFQTGRNFGGQTYMLAVWRRALSPAEVAQIGTNPWQIFEPHRARIYAFPSATGGVTVLATGVSTTAQTGSATAIGGAVAGTTGVSTTAQTGSATAIGGAVAGTTGVSATGQVGDVTVVTTGSVTAIVTGVSTTAQTGSATAIGGAVAGTSGVSTTGQVGNVIVVTTGSVTAVVSGVTTTAQTGSATAIGGAVAISSGVSTNGEVGNVTVAVGNGATVLINGVETVSDVGTVTVISVGNIVVVVSGVQAIGVVGDVFIYQLPPNWTNINPLQPSGWVPVDDSQTPNWVEITS